MKALIYEGPREMNLKEIDPPVPGSGEVLIRVSKAGICGSELSGYLGQNSLRKPPLVMGHGFSGIVAGVHEGAVRFDVGDRVTVNPLISCGRCPHCKMGAAQLCADRRLLGAHLPGAFAEYVVVPEENTYPLPEQLSLDEGATLEPFACAVRACRLARVSPADRLLIVGAGPIGLLVLQTAGIFGSSNVVVMDINGERLEIARELGGMAVRSAKELQDAAPYEGFDVAFDAAGTDETRRRCIESVSPGGRVMFSGLHSADSPLPVNLTVRNELRLQGVFAYAPTDFELALRWLAEGKATLAPWTVRAPLEEGSSCFEKLLREPGKVAKILLEID
jgi:2-desacetyl-2-hydroxyethyl bacteriochlorophyllide A dehydrogenase